MERIAISKINSAKIVYKLNTNRNYSGARIRQFTYLDINAFIKYFYSEMDKIKSLKYKVKNAALILRTNVPFKKHSMMILLFLQSIMIKKYQ